MQTREPRPDGFTLVELLVVIAIIGGLSGLLFPVIRSARIKSKVTSGSNTVKQLSLALESYNSQYGDYPPTSIGDAYDVATDGLNEGNESLLAHLCTQNKGGPFFDFQEDSIANLDNDRLNDEELLEELNWVFGDNQLREYLDPFGNPYVYYHNRDYERGYRIFQKDGRATTAQPGMSPKTANYYSVDTFQIWSLGADGINQNGANDDEADEIKDDIGSW